jgi:hypothetical protein
LADISLLQLKAECLAVYAKRHKTLPDLLAYVRKNQGVPACILLSSIFCHVEVPSQVLPEFVAIVGNMMNNPKFLVFATHAACSLLLTHQPQLAALDVCGRYYQLLFELLHWPASLKPLTMIVLNEFFTLLIESLLDLSSKYSLLLELVLISFNKNPIRYAKITYFKCSQSIFRFAWHLARLARIKLGETKLENLALSAYAAFSDYLKFGTWDVDVGDILPKACGILQQTGDDRAVEFILDLSRNISEADIAIWTGSVYRSYSKPHFLTGGWSCRLKK